MGEGYIFDNRQDNDDDSYERRLKSLSAAPQRLIDEGKTEEENELIYIMEGCC